VCPEGKKIDVDKVYLARKALGICIGCGVKKASDETVRCDECRKEDNDNSVKRHKRLKASGLCGSCLRNKPAPGMKMCASCRMVDAREQEPQVERDDAPERSEDDIPF